MIINAGALAAARLRVHGWVPPSQISPEAEGEDLALALDRSIGPAFSEIPDGPLCPVTTALLRMALFLSPLEGDISVVTRWQDAPGREPAEIFALLAACDLHVAVPAHA